MNCIVRRGRACRAARLYRWDGTAAYLAAPRRVNSVRRLAADFGPGAILTVVAGYSWITAAAFAQQQNLPLHLIIHDDVPATLAVCRRRCETR